MRALTGLVRGAARWSAGRAAGQVAYRAGAELAARWLLSLDAVEGVYLTGSVTRPSRVDPGFSDIDLVVVAELGTIDDELRLRRALARRLRRLCGLVPAFRQLQYVSPDELPLLRVAPNAWSLDLDRRWVCLCGEDRLEPGSEPIDGPARRREQLRRALRRWAKASPGLLEGARDAGARRVAARLLRDLCALTLDRDRLARWDVLRRKPPPTLAGRLPARPDADIEASLVASLRLLETLAAEVPVEGEGWRVEGAGPPRASPVATDGLQARAAFLDPAGQRRARLLLAFTQADSREAVALAMAEPSTGVLLTPPLWRVAWLLAPAPFVGASLALGGEAPPAPSRGQLDAALPHLLLERLVRARSRRLRVDASDEAARVAGWREIEVLAAGLVALRDGAPIRFSPRDAPAGFDEDALVRATRALREAL